MKRVMIGLIVVAVLAAAGFLAYRQFLAPEPETETIDVDTLSVDIGVDQVSAEGEVVPLDFATLSFQDSGRVAEILVEEGDIVQAGDPLLRLDTTDQEIALIQAQAGLAQAEANLETAQAGLSQAQTGLAAAEVGVAVAQAQLALTAAEPSPEQIAVDESNLALAEANTALAESSRGVTLEAATTAEIEAARAQVAAAEAQMLPVRNERDELVREDAHDEDILYAQLDLNAAIVNMWAAQAALDEVLAGATASERQAANASVAAALAQRDGSQAQLDLLLAGAKLEEVFIAEVSVEQAHAAVAEAELAIARAEIDVAQAEVGVVEAQAAVASAEAALERMTLTAPRDGTVADVPVKLGEVVSPGMPVLTLADLDGWLVETTDLTELDVVAVEVGHPAEVTLDAISGETLAGTVTDIGATSNLVQGDVTYVVTIRLDETSNLPLRWGMTAFVRIDVD